MSLSPLVGTAGPCLGHVMKRFGHELGRSQTVQKYTLTNKPSPQSLGLATSLTLVSAWIIYAEQTSQKRPLFASPFLKIFLNTGWGEMAMANFSHLSRVACLIWVQGGTLLAFLVKLMEGYV